MGFNSGFKGLNTGFCNREGICLLRGTKLICNYFSDYRTLQNLHSVKLCHYEIHYWKGY